MSAKPRIRAKPTLDAEVLSTHLETAHTGASTTLRDVLAWRPARRSPDADLLPDLPMLVSRARDIDRNNGVAKGGVQTLVDNVVGTGLRNSSRPNYRILKKDKAWAIDWSARYEALFHEWWWSTACHAGNSMTGDQMTAQVFRSSIVNGDWLALPLWITDRGDGFNTKIQTVESDRLSQPNDAPPTIKLRDGIEFDPYGAPIAYHIRKTHPGDDLYLQGNSDMFKWERIPRYTPFGRARVLHGFDPERPGQSRGKPLLTSVLSQFKQGDRYTNAEIAAAVANAMVAGIIYTDLNQDAILELFNGDHKQYLAAREANAVKLESGSLLPLFPGDKVEPFIPSRPAAQFGTFVENIYRIIAVGLDMPYELLMKDFSKTSYSSARASMLEAWRSFIRRRDWLGTQWMDAINLLFMEEVVNDGRIEAPDFYQYRRAYTRARWIGPGRGWIDPVKEATAAKLRIDNNFSTLEDECADQGKDWREVLEQRSYEQDEIERLGLTPMLPLDPNVTPGSAADGSDKPDDEKQPDDIDDKVPARKVPAREAA